MVTIFDTTTANKFWFYTKKYPDTWQYGLEKELAITILIFLLVKISLVQNASCNIVATYWKIFT